MQFWMELIYSLIIVISCSVIYIKTKELYELTSHKGIKYFRNAFLFFGIAYLSRMILRLFIIIDGPEPINIFLFNLGYFIFLYAGLMAGFYLIYSSVWKKFNDPEKLGWFFHPIALTITAIFIIFLFGPLTLLILAIIFLTAAILAYKRKKSLKRDSFNKVHIIYMLLFISLILNAIAHFIIIISLYASILLYLISSVLFLVILYRVTKSMKR